RFFKSRGRALTCAARAGWPRVSRLARDPWGSSLPLPLLPQGVLLLPACSCRGFCYCRPRTRVRGSVTADPVLAYGVLFYCSCVNPFSHASSMGIPSHFLFAGTDSRDVGCEKGFSHQRQVRRPPRRGAATTGH